MRAVSDQPPHTTTATTTTTASVSQAGSPILQPRALGHYHQNRLSNSFSQHGAFLPDPASPELISSSPALATAGPGANLPEQRIIPGLVHERTRKGSNYSMSSSGAVTAATRADLLHSQSQLQSQAASPSRFETETGGDGSDYGVI